jgi:Peptidase family M28
MKRIFLCSAVVVTTLVATAFIYIAEDGGIQTDPGIRAIVNSVDATHIQNTVHTLEAFGTRNSCSTSAPAGRGVNAARDFIFSQFSAIPGLQVRLDPFVHGNCPTSSTFNVIAWLPGTGHPDRLVIIGGHYDSRTINVLDATSDAPGANDSGAQTAVVLEAARVLTTRPHDATLVFISFSGEEQGLFGSASIAANLTRYFANPQVVAMLNTDIPGGDNTVNGTAELQQFRLYSSGIPRETRSTDPDGTPDNTSPSRGLMRFIGTWGAAYVPSMTMVPKLREDRPGRASDHRSFINHGSAAVRFMETFECSPSPVDNSCGGGLPCPPPANIPASCKDFNTSHQHSPFDQSQFVTPSYAARIAQVMVGTAATLARAPGSPMQVAAAGSTSDAIKVSWQSPDTGRVDHFVLAARSVSENFYRRRIAVDSDVTFRAVSPGELGFQNGDSFFISVAAVDEEGHESLFAFPEMRCDATSCVNPSGATVPVTSPARDVEDEEE